MVTYRLEWNEFVWGNNWHNLPEMKAEMRRLAKEYPDSEFKVIKITKTEEEIEVKF